MYAIPPLIEPKLEVSKKNLMEIEIKEENYGVNLQKIILSHLTRKCSQKTVQAFINQIDEKTKPEFVNFDEKTFTLKKEIPSLILEGQLEKAKKLLDENFATLIRENEEIEFEFLTHQFIEIVQKKDLKAALNFARINLSKFADNPKFSEATQELLLLIVNHETINQPHFNLEMKRKNFASLIESLISKKIGLSEQNPLEIIFRQSKLVKNKLKASKKVKIELDEVDSIEDDDPMEFVD
ncbi:vacuolar import and degradation protein [Anaeramoeba ignava]|uniref:Vacuolar import and degradation protein n=1 Tax=Anaeramoeba ignava TaxID=1746090 RepID=A0A9Q0REY7_ANAIG|nr:vacuolar import and degradation protein [Anaeramoeba ignava]